MKYRRIKYHTIQIGKNPCPPSDMIDAHRCDSKCEGQFTYEFQSFVLFESNSLRTLYQPSVSQPTQLTFNLPRYEPPSLHFRHYLICGGKSVFILW